MHPRAIATSIVALGLAFVFVVWMGRVSDEPIAVAKPKPQITDSDKPKVAESGPHPKAVFVDMEHDFGMMRMLESGSHVFVVRNEGEAPLVLKTGETSCQCTIGELSENIVAPGESTNIELKWTVKKPAPRFQHSADIWTNDPDNLSVPLMISGFIGRDVMVLPEGSWSFGTLDTINDVSFEGLIVSQTFAEMKLVEASIDSEDFSVEIEKMDQEEIDRRYRNSEFTDSTMASGEPPRPVSGYLLTVKPIREIPVGLFSERLEFTVKLNDSAPEVKEGFEVTGTRAGPFDFLPLPGCRWNKQLMLMSAGIFNADEGKKMGLILVVRGGEEQLQVSDTTADPDWIKVSTELMDKVGNASRVKIHVEFPPGCPRVVRRVQNLASISLKTNHPDARDIKLKLGFISQ